MLLTHFADIFQPEDYDKYDLQTQVQLYSAETACAAHFQDVNFYTSTLTALVAGIEMKESNAPMPSITDTRVHMLKPGWYPAIPGLHCDEVERDSDTGALDWEATEILTEKRHYMCILDPDGTESLTEFNDYRKFPRVSRWGQLKQAQPGNTTLVKPNTLYSFGTHDLHRATPAIASGWRYFFRLTINSTRPVLNDVRTQTQVYIPSPSLNEGW